MATFWWGEVAKLPFFHAHSSVMMVVAEGKAKATALLLQEKERAYVCTVHPNRQHKEIFLYYPVSLTG